MRHKVVLDCEVYRDYFLVMFRSVITGKGHYFELYPGHELNARAVMQVLHEHLTVGFNSRYFDIPMITLACAGADNLELKQASDWLILNEEATPWGFEKRYGVRLPEIDHVDLMETAPGVMVGLKLYGARMHTHTLQDLPIDPDASIAPEDRALLREYCDNDLTQTAELYQKLLPQLSLREKMSEQYGLDLRSKSDAQIAEAVIKSEIEAIQGTTLRRPTNVETEFHYQPPDWLSYKSDMLSNLLEDVMQTPFTVGKSGSVVLPPTLSSRKIAIGSSVYRMGIGGLHSSEKSVAHVTDGSFILVDRDVAAYYPSIILNEKLYPKNLGEDFLDVYRSIVQRRLEAKRIGDKVTDGSLKITINGSFGKLGSKWSVLYSPQLMIQVTVTGQLALLMLIEQLEGAGMTVVSANTDGVVVRCPTDRECELAYCITQWEAATGFTTEETRYKALYSRDVNNYIAVKKDGSVKTKGIFASPGLMKNPTNMIVNEAVVDYVTKRLPVSETIRACSDVCKFLTVRTVAGGAEQGGKYLGKVVRWYYSTRSPGPITYRSNGNKAARSDGSKALMVLPNRVPDDLDYDWYVREAESILREVGV